VTLKTNDVAEYRNGYCSPCRCREQSPGIKGFLRVLCAFAVNFLPILAVISFTATEAGASEFFLRPAITLSEEYDDNIFLTPTDRVEDYITRVVPSLSFHYKAERWDWDLSYAYDYRYYAKGARKRDETQVVDLKTKTELIKNYFFLRVDDDYRRVSLDATRDFANESLFVNQSDRNTFTVNPYLVLAPGSRSTPVIGYTYVNTWYKDPTGIDTVDHIGYVDVTTLLSSRTTLTTGARYTRENSRIQDFDKTDIYTGPKYDYAQNSYIFFTIGNSWFNFGEGTHATQPFWNAGITHQYSTLTASFITSLSYVPDPLRVLRRQDRYEATISKKTERSSLSVSGSLTEYRNAETKHLEDTAYRLGGAMRYAVTPRSSIAVDLAIERHKEYETDTARDLYLNGVRFERRVAEKVTAALAYRYSNSYSHDVFLDNYYDNRVIFEINGSF
jgi:hypothetical protein